MAPSSLPPEIILKIISYALPPVLTSNYERSRRLEILRSFSLISRPWRIVSQAELFKSPWLRTPSSAKLFLAPPGLGLRIEGGAQEWVGALSSRGLEFGVASYENWRGEDNRREEWKEWNGLIKTITGMGEEVGPSLVALRLNRMDGIDLFLIVNSLQNLRTLILYDVQIIPPSPHESLHKRRASLNFRITYGAASSASASLVNRTVTPLSSNLLFHSTRLPSEGFYHVGLVTSSSEDVIHVFSPRPETSLDVTDHWKEAASPDSIKYLRYKFTRSLLRRPLLSSILLLGSALERKEKALEGLRCLFLPSTFHDERELEGLKKRGIGIVWETWDFRVKDLCIEARGVIEAVV